MRGLGRGEGLDLKGVHLWAVNGVNRVADKESPACRLLECGSESSPNVSNGFGSQAFGKLLVQQGLNVSRGNCFQGQVSQDRLDVKPDVNVIASVCPWTNGRLHDLDHPLIEKFADGEASSIAQS